MKKIILIVLVVISINCFSQSKNFIDQNFIEVAGKAEIEIIPNEIYLKIVLNEKDFKGKENLENMEKSMIDKLVGIGINVSKNLSVKDMTSNFKNYWIKDSEIKTKKVFLLKVIDAITAGTVFQELELANISNITIERVDHSEIQNYRQQVKVEAIKAAKNKADILANAINQTCGDAIYVQELNKKAYNTNLRNANTSNIIVREFYKASNTKKPDIKFQEIKLTYSILVRFKLE